MEPWNFVAEFKEVRHRLGITQRELASRLKISENYVNLIENGKRTPSEKIRYRLDYIAKENNLESTTTFISILSQKAQQLNLSVNECKPLIYDETLPLQVRESIRKLLMSALALMQPIYGSFRAAIQQELDNLHKS